MANSVDPDQMLHSEASVLGLHCLQRPISPNTYGYYGNGQHHFSLYEIGIKFKTKSIL